MLSPMSMGNKIGQRKEENHHELRAEDGWEQRTVSLPLVKGRPHESLKTAGGKNSSRGGSCGAKMDKDEVEEE